MRCTNREVLMILGVLVASSVLACTAETAPANVLKNSPILKVEDKRQPPVLEQSQSTKEGIKQKAQLLNWGRFREVLNRFELPSGRVLMAILLVVALIAVVGWRYLARRSTCWPRPPNDNGIGVGAPKLYDTRSLSLMLEEMQDQLRRLNNISQKPLTDSLTDIQGRHTATYEGSVDVAIAKSTAATSPQGAAAEDKKVDAAKKPDPGKDAGSVSDALSDRAGKVGERSGDLLMDQVNLTYEVLNLRLLLERALSDRLFNGDKPRLQAVFGFPISVNTPEFASGCCANIEVTIKAEESDDPPSLVALLPQEKTYNTIIGRRRSSAFGLSGPIKLFNLGAKGRAQSEATYLERDADTVAFIGEISKDDKGNPKTELRFGWQLRPMSGYRSVTAGLRQMFAVLALPKQDVDPKDKIALDIQVRTYWRRFNLKTSTSSDRLNLKAWISNRPVELEHKWKKSFEVDSTVVVEGSLKPYLYDVRWQAVGPTRAVIMAEGRNFFPGTTVVLGDETYRTAEDGLIVKSEKTLQVNVPIAALMNDAILNGRYGPSQPLFLPPAHLPQLTLDSVSLSRLSNSRVSELRMDFSVVDAQETISWKDFVALADPLLQVNGQLVNSPLRFYPITPQSNSSDIKRVGCVTLVPSELVPAGNCSVLLKFPMFGPQWTFSYQLFFRATPDLRVDRIQKSGTASLLISGTRFVPSDGQDKGGKSDWKVRLDKEYEVSEQGELQRLRANLLELTVADNVLKENDTLVVLPPDESPALVLSVPSAPPVGRIPMFDPAAQALVVTISASATTLKVKGAYLDSITSVKFDNEMVLFVAAVGGQSLTVELKAGMVAIAGAHQLILADTYGHEYLLPVLATLALA